MTSLALPAGAQAGAAPATVGESSWINRPLRFNVGRRSSRSQGPLASPETGLKSNAATSSPPPIPLDGLRGPLLRRPAFVRPSGARVARYWNMS